MFGMGIGIGFRSAVRAATSDELWLECEARLCAADVPLGLMGFEGAFCELSGGRSRMCFSNPVACSSLSSFLTISDSPIFGLVGFLCVDHLHQQGLVPRTEVAQPKRWELSLTRKPWWRRQAAKCRQLPKARV